MAIYDKPVWRLMWDMVKDLNLQPGETISRRQVLDWFRRNYPRIKQGTISAHLIRLSTNAPSRLHYNAKPKQDDLFFQIDGSHFRLYEPDRDPPPISAETEAGTSLEEVVEEAEELAEPTTFAYERDLQNFLARNLGLIEPGLRLYEEDDITGIEFPAGGRFIDILALDRENNYVIIELKVSRGYDRVVGQLLRYMAWIETEHAEPGQRVRGVIIAREISEDLRLACSRIQDVQLFEYALSVSLQPVQTGARL
jgi:endonuclease